MSIETVYLMRRDDPGAALRELDDVRVLVDVLTDDGDMILAGTEGTVVAIWGQGKSVEVEFPEPMGALAIVGSTQVERIGRSVP